jgi:hypothetical protein
MIIPTILKILSVSICNHIMPFDKQGIECLKIVICVLSIKSKEPEEDTSEKSKTNVNKNKRCKRLVIG